jgi:hypothetical protein
MCPSAQFEGNSNGRLELAIKHILNPIRLSPSIFRHKVELGQCHLTKLRPQFEELLAFSRTLE